MKGSSICVKKKIYVWGTGFFADYLTQNEEILVMITGFVDNVINYKSFKGKKVISPSALIKESPDLIIIASSYHSTIANQCLEMGIDYSKLVFFPFSLQISYGNTRYIQKNFGTRFLDNIKHRSSEITGPQSRLMHDSENYYYNYVRFKTFELCANEIISESIVGAVAELGVFQGEFSEYINYMFPDRYLYLFDTFEGYSKNEIAVNIEENKRMIYDHYKDTDENVVLDRMPHKEKVIIKKGYFPTTTVDIENELFSFVSIDVGFEKVTYDGLSFFYPRLSKGGMIFLYAYNSKVLNGTRVALSQYEKEIGERLNRVPLCDTGGTLIILK